MADTVLSPTGLTQIEIGASEDTWGDKLNDNFGILNTAIEDIQDDITAIEAELALPDGLVLIGSSALSGSATAFTSIPAGYRRLLLVLNGMSSSADGSFSVSYSINNGGGYTSYYASSNETSPSILSGSIELVNYDYALAAPVFGACALAVVNGNFIPKSPVALPGAAINALRVSCSAGTFDGGTAYLIAE